MIERVMTRLPESTRSWRCPYFRGILWFGSMTALSGSAAETLPGTIVAIGAMSVVGFAVGTRESDQGDGVSCSR